MATDPTNRGTIIRRVGLLGASAGIVLGLFEAGCMRLTDMPLALQKPHVAPYFWFFVPLLASVVFGLLGLLAGFLATLLQFRFLGMLMIAGLAGLAGGYFRLVLESYPSARVWFIFLREVITPSLVFALVFGCTLAVLWTTRTPGSPLGTLAGIPIRLWSGVVLGLVAVLVVAVGFATLPNHLMASATHPTGRSPSPNIVLIVWDTTRADHFSSYGYFRNTTPNADQFSQRGVLFENAIAPSSWTLPAMASILTSLLPHQHGAGADIPLGNGPRTLPELLRVGGYETAGFNANPHFGAAACGLARGFETYVDSTTTLGYSLDATRFGHDFIKPLTEAWFHRSRFNQFNAHQLNKQIYHWFDHRSDRPFFLFVQYNDMHDPYEVPSPFDHLYGQISRETKSRLVAAKLNHFDFSTDQRKNLAAAYDNTLKYTDSQMGELLQFLEHSAQWSNTYVIITADHGEAFGEHNTYTHGWDLYREVVHVPLIVVGPGVPAGARITSTATTPQIFPTVLEWAGLKQAAVRQSSLARLWSAHDGANTPDEATLSEIIDATPPPESRGMISVTTREWQLIYQRSARRSKLYHWPTDPLEQQDVSELPENQATLEALKAKTFSLVERSYRPWRDTRYLEALLGPGFSPDDEARKSARLSPEDSLLPPGPGAPQTLFPPNPETPQSKTRKPDEDLLRSLPYGGEQ
jgi:arylsulfatase A-like enzyme